MSVQTVLIVLLALGVVLYRNLKGRFVTSGSPYRLPLILLALGLWDVLRAHFPLVPLAALVIAADLVLAVLLGAARGASIGLSTRDGYLYQRGGPATLALWVASIALRLGLAYLAHLVGVGAAAEATLLLSFGVSLIVQAAVLARRVASTGQPVRPGGDRDARRGRVRGRSGHRSPTAPAPLGDRTGAGRAGDPAGGVPDGHGSSGGRSATLNP